MIENLIKEYDSKNNNNLSNFIEGLNLNGLVNFYLKCSNHLYFQKYNNIGNMLEYVYKIIKNKLSSVTIIELMGIYTNIFIEALNIEESINANNNIVRVRTASLKDDFFLNFEPKRRKMSREQFIDMYTREMDYYEKDSLYLKSVFSFVDKLQQEIADYIDNAISKLSDEEKNILLIRVNEIIENNSLKIIEENESKTRIIDIYSKMKEIPTFEISNISDTKKYENYVYESFRGSLMKKNIKKK